MTDVSEAAMAKAKEKLGVGAFAQDVRVFADFIQQVSDEAKAIVAVHGDDLAISAFILPDTPSDPLYDALFAVVEMGRYDTKEQTELLRRELAERGLEIREVNHDIR